MYGLACGVLMFGVVSGLCILTSAAIFMAVSAVSKNFEQSNQLVMPILTVLFLFSGFFVPANKIPAMWKWVPDVNFIYYSCERSPPHHHHHTPTHHHQPPRRPPTR